MSNETQTETMDEKYADAVALCEKKGRVSAALIQRGLGISYTRAAKIEAAIKAEKTNGTGGHIDPHSGTQPVEETAGGATVVADAPADVSADDYRSQEYDDGEPTAAPAVPDVLAAANLTGGEHDLPVALIRESEKNTRTDFARDGLLLLSDTLQDEQIGQVKPIDVYRLDEPDANGCFFELLDGARRFRAAKLAERATIRARIVPAGTEADRLVRRLMANTGEPLNAIELGEAYVHLLKHCNGDKKRAARMAGLGDDGVRVFEQTMQLVTDLIPPVLQALRDGRITKSHAALLCRVEAKHQNEMLQQCFEARNVFNGASHEPIPTLISEKELRGKIAARFPKEDGQKQGKLFDGATNGVAKDKNDLDREHQQKLEERADELIEGSGEEAEGSGQNAEGGNERQARRKEDICDVCGVAPSIGQGEGGKRYCQGCHTKKVLANEQPESDYEADSAKRVDRMARALECVKSIPPFGPAWLTRIALQLCPPHVNNAVFCKVYGQGLTIGRGNNVVWDEETEGTVSDYIQSLSGMATEDACFHLRRCILVFLALPAQNPAYPADVIEHIENSVTFKIFQSPSREKPIVDSLTGVEVKPKAKAKKQREENEFAKVLSSVVDKKTRATAAKKSDKIPASKILKDAKAAAKSKLKPANKPVSKNLGKKKSKK